MTKVLVTGGLGFVGSNLCPALLEQGYSVRVLDNNISSAVLEMAGVSRVHGDICDAGDVAEALQEVDAVVHLAAIPGVEDCANEPGKALETNVQGTLNLLEQANKGKIKHIVLASSVGAVLGIQNQPTNEEMLPHPTNIYGWSKLMAERLVGKYPAKATILRFTNIYGENSQLKSSIVAKLLLRKPDSPFTIYGDGEQTRDFVYIGDVNKAISLALEKEVGGIYHIGLGKGIKLLDLVRKVGDVTGETIPVLFRDVRLGDIKDNWTDLSKAKRELGYKPEYNIGAGVEKTWNWAKKLLEKPIKDKLTRDHFKQTIQPPF
tara:strand:+ start:17890 stop:18846 length:957 start_codon:yes stop_codon:yes gene_type:complete